MKQQREPVRRRFLRRGLKAAAGLLAIAAAAVLNLPALPARADGPAPSSPSSVFFDQNLDAQIPLDVTFQNEEGQTVRLGDYVGSTPIVLTLNYYHCPNLCSLELDQLAQSFADLEWTLGKQYQVVTVSIDPRETPAQAAESKWLRLRAYARPNTGPGWHFLVGDEASIARLTQTVGFHYTYDAQLDEYEHPTGVIVLTPQGKVARYLYGVDFPSTDLRLALTEASLGKIGSPVEQILLYCYHYDPATGRYSLAILDMTRWLGVMTVFALGGFLFFMFRRDFRQNRAKDFNE
jgi:protein SCO1